MVTASAFTIGYYFYLKIEKEFNEKYGARKLPKRIANGIAYLIFLLLFREAVYLQFKPNPDTWIIIETVLVLTVGVGFFIFLEITISTVNFLNSLKNKLSKKLQPRKETP